MSISQRVIWKWPLSVADSQMVDMHRVRQLLTVQLQDGKPTLWAVINPFTVKQQVEIRCYGTGNGNPSPEDAYLGTVQINGFVWHFFERSGESQ